MGRWHSKVDYAAYLDQLQAYHHNFFRLWIADAAWSAQPGGEGFFEPQPFVRTGPGNALDGKPRFDLTKLNQAYFDELRQHVVMARDRGTYVAVMLFDTWGVGGYGHKGLWQGNPFNASNNINDLDGDPNGDGKGIEVHTLKIPAVTRIQEAYVRKVIDSVNDLDNVLYEVLNEGGDSGVLDWMKYFAKFIKDYEATKPKQHPVGITGFLEPGWDQSRANAELFLTDADWTSPYGLGPTAPYAVDPPAADGRKVVISDTDHTEVPRDSEDPLVATIWVWKSFTRGMNPIHMDAMGTLAAHMSPRERERECDQNTRRAMGNTRTMADRMDLVDMVPRGDLASTSYCLASPGKEYLAYLPEGGEATLDLSGASGTLRVEWMHPVKGTITAGEPVTGGAKRTFAAPFAGSAALHVWAGRAVETTDE